MRKAKRLRSKREARNRMISQVIISAIKCSPSLPFYGLGEQPKIGALYGINR